MFVEITEPKAPLVADALFRECYRGNKEITPEICMAVLRSTNFKTCMKRMLLCIEKFDVDTQVAYAEVVKSVFCNREQPKEVIEIGRRLARNNGYEHKLDELLEVREWKDYYIESSPNAGKIKLLGGFTFYGTESFEGYKGVKFLNSDVRMFRVTNLPEYVDFCSCYKVHLSDCGFDNVKRMTFRERSRASFSGLKVMPPELDVAQFKEFGATRCDFSGMKNLCFENAAAVMLNGVTGLSGDIAAPKAENVFVLDSDLAGIERVELADGCSADFGYSKNIPATDVSGCKNVNFAFADLHRFEALKFRDDATAVLSDATGIPAKSDFSNCKYVICGSADLGAVEEFKLKAKAVANLTCVHAMPKILDFSAHDRVDADTVDIEGCTFVNVEEMRFKEGAKVLIEQATGFKGKVLDFSKCDEVNLDKSNLEGVKNIIFKEGAKVVLNGCRNLPQNLDVSMCSSVSLKSCDLKELPHLTFQKGAEVFFDYAGSLPKTLDLSNCSQVSFNNCDCLSMVEEIKFAKGAEVGFRNTKNLPQILDLSTCGRVDFVRCQFNNINKIKFADTKQLEESGAVLPFGLQKTVTFADEERSIMAKMFGRSR